MRPPLPGRAIRFGLHYSTAQPGTLQGAIATCSPPSPTPRPRRPVRGIARAWDGCHMRAPTAIKEGFRKLPPVVTAGVLLADLARPVSPEEYRRIIGQQVVLHEPLSAETRAYYQVGGG